MIIPTAPLEARANDLLEGYKAAELKGDLRLAMEQSYELVRVACMLHEAAWQRKRLNEGKQ